LRRHKTLQIAQLQLQQQAAATGIIVSTLAEAEFFFAGGHPNITFGSPIIPW
jgi:D-serine deaminase-like pyridoxal phosphate-dependent protein